MLDKIQRRAIQFIPGLRDLRYEEILKRSGLTTLETRILRGNQLEVFKIWNGYDNIDTNIFDKINEMKIQIGCQRVFIFPEDHQRMGYIIN